MRKIITAAALIISPIALAAEPQKFVPFTVTDDDMKALDAQLGEMPIKTMPAVRLVGQWVQGMEQRAIAAQKAEDDAKAKADKP